MKMIVTLLAGCAFLSAGCKPGLLPSPTEAHRLAAPAKVKAWVRAPDGSLVEEKIQLQAGDYCASGRAMDAVPVGKFQ
jgi:hypothetical protein